MRKIIAFTGEQCAPCAQLKPVLKELTTKYQLQLEIVELDETTQKKFAKYRIRSVPTVICVDGDIEIGRFLGVMTPMAVEIKLTEWL
jgi:thioredoxin-like negative regulator of GroEL